MTEQVIEKPALSNSSGDFSQEATLIIKSRTQNDITFSVEDLAKTFLSPTDLAKCYKPRFIATLFGHNKFTFGKSAGEHWQKATRNNPNISWEYSDKFEWTGARKLIMRKYGFSDLKYEGKKTAAIGLKLKSTLNSPENVEPHIQRVGQLIKDFKAKTTNTCYMDTKGCIVQLTCTPQVMAKLAEIVKA